MKTTNVVLTVAAMIVSSAFVFAADPSAKIAIVNRNNSAVYKVIYEGVSGSKATIKITNSAGEVVLTETVNENRFSWPLNFAGLTSDVYTVSITDKSGTVSKQVNYKISKEASAETTDSRYVRVNKLENGKYFLAVSSQVPGKINVTILDTNDNVIYNEGLEVKGNLAMVYNIQKIEGAPVFRITDGNGFSKVIK